jgi:hypothetical protein
MNPVAILGRTSAAAVTALLCACNFGSQDAPLVTGRALWIANGKSVIEYLPAQLSPGTANLPPHRALKSAVLGSPRSLTFDSDGNLWVADTAGMIKGTATPAVFEFSAAQIAALAADPAPSPTMTITSMYFTSPEQTAFDVSGNLWVTDRTSNTLLEFSASQLTDPTNPPFSPALVVSSPGLNGPAGLTFDAAGDLWVANGGSIPAGTATSAPGNSIIEFAANNIPEPPQGGTDTNVLAPDLILSDDGHESLKRPWGLAFDAAGMLWVGNADSPTEIVGFSPASLAESGNPSPSIAISGGTVEGMATLNAVHGICLDDIGGLAAVSSAGDYGVAYFVPVIPASGASPSTFLAGDQTTLHTPGGCSFSSIVH